ncbi:MAG: MFS transporter [Burkholderiaceae bacterium]
MFYGWWVVWGTFALMAVCAGTAVYGVSVLLHAFVDEGRFDLGQASFAAGLFSIASGMVGVVVGRLLERVDIRLVMTGGVLIMASSLGLLPLVRDPLTLSCFFLAFGIGFGTAAIVPSTTIIARWFTRQRASAMSIAATGNSVGAIVVTPVVVWLIASRGIDGASPWLAVLLLATSLPVIWGVLRSSPAARGLEPLGGATELDRATTPQAVAQAHARASRTRFFRLGLVALILAMGAHVGGQAHLFNLLMERGAGGELASAALALMAGASVAARFPAVIALERMSPRGFMIVLMAIQALALVGVGLAASPVALAIGIAAYGATIGSFMTGLSLLLVDAFGVAVYARLYGLARVWLSLGVLLGPGLMGWLHQHAGGYGPAYLAVAALSLAGALTQWAAGPAPR